MRHVWAGALLFWLPGFVTSVSAVEGASRISDRGVVEALAELKAGQKVLQQQIADVKGQVGDLKQSTQQQMNDLRQDMNQRFQDMSQRFNDLRQDMHQRFNDMMTLLQILIGVLALVLGGMLTWLIVVWRRLVQVEEKQKAFELQGDEIKFLREGYGRLQEMFLRVLERS